METWRNLKAIIKKVREKFEWKRQIRRLEVTRAGKWYIALTIALGVTALASGNNAIYLIESLLLAGLIHSGIQSEKQVSSVRVEFIRVQAKAKEATSDWVVVHNEEKRTLFCLEIGEWKDGTFRSIAFFPKIKGNETVRVRSSQEIHQRRTYRWDGFAIATSFPFGFAKKIKVVRKPGERVIWPTPISLRRKNGTDPVGERGNRNPEIDVVEGEIRKYDWNDDARLIVANQSIRGLGAMVRNRRPVLKEPEVILDLRKESGEAFELSVRKASSHFYQSENADLILLNSQGRKKVIGKQAALTALALVESERKSG
jgi:uncharacterized protein (DUF58 family)